MMEILNATSEVLREKMRELHAYGYSREIYDFPCANGYLTIKFIYLDDVKYMVVMLNGECIGIAVE